MSIWRAATNSGIKENGYYFKTSRSSEMYCNLARRFTLLGLEGILAQLLSCSGGIKVVGWVRRFVWLRHVALWEVFEETS
ncbi:unnamed protein product [Brugia timori]|uniref:Calpain catalytic domain-containing protein n=1 Tax=Brugia timori TaxID=42155 RepID=A0A0R3Q3N4_9BILA|nr:unnamed protein product [Brugia timori]